VTAGYFRHPDATAASFGAVLDGRSGYLRTGDIGFLRDGELYVTARRKDLIIVAGRNHHPHDIEATVFEAHPALRLGCAAAFAVDDGAEEHVVVVQEVNDDAVARPVAAVAVAAVRRSVAEAHELRVSAVVLIRKSTLDKTSSGKIQRSASRARFAGGTLDVVASWRSTRLGGSGEVEYADDVRTWLRARVSALTGVAERDLADGEPLASYGIGSVEAAELTGGLAEIVGRSLPDSYLYDHPTIDRVAAAVEGRAPAPVVEVRRPHDGTDEIAIVGIGCRVPGASSARELWALLRGGRDAVGEVPADRWPAMPEPALRWAGLVDDLTSVDTGFFGLSPREAAAMDPQQRMLLAVGWEAVEDAGLDPTALAGTDAGCFVGVWSPEFALRADFADPYLTTGSAHSIAANRLSYQLDLRGPSIAIDTACSSSLVAVHLAVRSLLDGECSIALAGGCNVVLSPEVTAAFAKAHLLSPTGRCRSFGADADGYVRAEGAVVVVLKRLADARADGDDVYAVIRGSAVNHDGRTNGLTAPSGAAQEAVIRAAHRRAGTRAGDVDLVEAHGSGTPVGDLIEAAALGATVGAGRAGTPCVLGSVKSNLGHLEAAAGAAGLVRAALSLYHREVPPTLHVDRVNPRLDLDALGLAVNTAPVPLPDTRPALAGVSSFGFGGANAHVVLAAADAVPSALPVPERAMLLPVSARTETALATLAGRYRALLDDPAVSAAALCHSAGRRAQHALRAGVVGADRAALRAALDGVRGVAAARGTLRFAFGEQGQAAGLGARLFLQEPVFRAAVTACAAVVADLAGWSLTDLLVSGPAVAPELAAPVRVAIHIGLVDLLAHWGIRADTATGDGDGALSAAYALGALDRATAMARVVRGEPGPSTGAADAVTTVDCQAGIPGAIPLLTPGADDRAGLLAVAARLYEAGYAPDWAAVCGTSAGVRPPAYPWDGVDIPLPGSAPKPAPAPAPAGGTAPVSPSERDYREVVRSAVADLLGTTPDRVDNHSTFNHLGMDSMTGVDLHERLEADLGVELPATAVLNYPSVARMAGFLSTLTTPATPAAPAEPTDEEVVDALLADLLPLLETDHPRKD
jgi:3-oxoacyl-(acyl-carrier-protein) synthase/acyl carrier protein